ncbi:hypothetical protein A2U01_0084275, partial [Trifolium medium]|nr:hypothetical protein [Trifolium medium]
MIKRVRERYQAMIWELEESMRGEDDENDRQRQRVELS